VDLEDGPVVVDSFRLLEATPGRALVEVVLHEGRKHVVRRLLAEAGHPVRQLVRNPDRARPPGELRPGRIRPLEPVPSWPADARGSA
jgi:23S rRNA pseudouridine2605 synthase